MKNVSYFVLFLILNTNKAYTQTCPNVVTALCSGKVQVTYGFKDKSKEIDRAAVYISRNQDTNEISMTYMGPNNALGGNLAHIRDVIQFDSTFVKSAENLISAQFNLLSGHRASETHGLRLENYFSQVSYASEYDLRYWSATNISKKNSILVEGKIFCLGNIGQMKEEK